MIPSSGLRQIFLLLLLVALFVLLSVHLHFMIDAILGAIILAILSVKPIAILRKRGLSVNNAELVYFLSTICAVIFPLATIVIIVRKQWGDILSFVQNYKNSLVILGKEIQHRFGVNIVDSDLIKTIVLKLSSALPKLFNSTLELLTTLGMMYFLLYFFIREGSDFRRGILTLMPFSEKNTHRLYDLIYQSVLSNTLMMPLVAMVQAVIAWVSYIIVGVDHAFIWFLATFFLAMLPFFGAALVYIPLGILLIFTGKSGCGVFILLWGFIVVSSSDNILRIFFMKRFDNTHPFITFLGVLAGLSIFGFLGIIFGPLLISLFLILIKIYQEEFVHTALNAEDHEVD